jgi:bacillithiol synthase
LADYAARQSAVGWRVQEPRPKPSFEARYRGGELADFFALTPKDTAAALELERPVQREGLARALRRYAAKLGAPQAVFEAINRLEHPASRAVVTGQQPGLLLGPMYTLSKAITSVRLAERLTSEERPVLPVFWVASQDHDRAEIDHCYLLDMGERLRRLSLPLPEGLPSGRMRLIAGWLEQLKSQLDDVAAPQPYKDEVLEHLGEAAGRAESFADLFGALLYRLLGEQGLIVVNPLEPNLARLFKRVLAREIEVPLASSKLINEAGERLKKLGETPQLGRAAAATNLFLEEDTRELLHFNGNRFYTRQGEYAKEELLGILEREPDRITPAAGLRPVTQDDLLPTAVTVVGPGELRYFAQLREVYELHEVAMPLIWPRAEVTLLEPPVRRILKKYGLVAEDIQNDFEGVRQRLLLERHGHARIIARRLGEIEASTNDLLERLGAIDPTLQRPVIRTGERLNAGIERLKSKAAAAIARQDDICARQLDRLRLHLMPEGTPQERLLSPYGFFLKFGIKYVLVRLLAIIPEGEHLVDL